MGTGEGITTGERSMRGADAGEAESEGFSLALSRVKRRGRGEVGGRRREACGEQAEGGGRRGPAGAQGRD